MLLLACRKTASQAVPHKSCLETRPADVFLSDTDIRGVETLTEREQHMEKRRDLLELAYDGYRLLHPDTWLTMSFIGFWTLIIIGTR